MGLTTPDRIRDYDNYTNRFNTGTYFSEYNQNFMFWRAVKFALSFFYDKYDGQEVFDEDVPTKMNPDEVLAKALPIAESLGWLVNRDGTVTEAQQPRLTKLWRNEKFVWRVGITYIQITGNDLGAFRRETLGYIFIDDATGRFIKREERMLFHKNSGDGSMSELDAIEFVRNEAVQERWEWHDPATAQALGDDWIIRTDTFFDAVGIYVQFNERTGKIRDKSYRPRKEKNAKMTREEAWEIAKRTAHEKEWVFWEPVCADFENGIWNIYLPFGHDYSASVKIDDETKKAVEVNFWSGLGGNSLHEKYDKKGAATETGRFSPYIKNW